MPVQPAQVRIHELHIEEKLKRPSELVGCTQQSHSLATGFLFTPDALVAFALSLCGYLPRIFGIKLSKPFNFSGSLWAGCCASVTSI
jgi:hypothetical protein